MFSPLPFLLMHVPNRNNLNARTDVNAAEVDLEGHPPK